MEIVTTPSWAKLFVMMGIAFSFICIFAGLYTVIKNHNKTEGKPIRVFKLIFLTTLFCFLMLFVGLFLVRSSVVITTVVNDVVPTHILPTAQDINQSIHSLEPIQDQSWHNNISHNQIQWTNHTNQHGRHPIGPPLQINADLALWAIILSTILGGFIFCVVKFQWYKRPILTTFLTLISLSVFTMFIALFSYTTRRTATPATTTPVVVVEDNLIQLHGVTEAPHPNSIQLQQNPTDEKMTQVYSDAPQQVQIIDDNSKTSGVEKMTQITQVRQEKTFKEKAEDIADKLEAEADKLEEKAEELEEKAEELAENIENKAEKFAKNLEENLENSVKNTVNSIEDKIKSLTNKAKSLKKQAKKTRRNSKRGTSNNPTVQIATPVPLPLPVVNTESNTKDLPDWTKFDEDIKKTGETITVKSEQFATKDEAKQDAIKKAENALLTQVAYGKPIVYMPVLITLNKMHTESIQRKVDKHEFKVYRVYINAEVDKKATMVRIKENKERNVNRKALFLSQIIAGIFIMLVIALLISNNKLKRARTTSNKMAS